MLSVFYDSFCTFLCCCQPILLKHRAEKDRMPYWNSSSSDFARQKKKTDITPRHNWFPPKIYIRGGGAEIPYWWCVTTQIWIVHLTGHAGKEICLIQPSTSTAKLWLVKCHQYGQELLQSFLRHHFARKPAMASRNVSCFLRLVTLPADANISS